MTAPATPPPPTPEAEEGERPTCPRCEAKLHPKHRHCDSPTCPWLRCTKRRCRTVVDVAKGLAITPAPVHRDDY